MEKAPEIVTQPIVCEEIKNGKISVIAQFSNNATPEMISSGVVTAASLVCNKAFKYRFTNVLMGACLNLTNC
jgi:hypothetical protein